MSVFLSLDLSPALGPMARTFSELGTIGFLFMSAVLFVLIYFLVCPLAALSPAVGGSEPPKVKLKSPWSYLLFLPLARKLHGFMLLGVIWQVINYLLFSAHIALGAVKLLGADIPVRAFDIPSYAAIFAALLGLAITVWLTVRGGPRRRM